MCRVCLTLYLDFLFFMTLPSPRSTLFPYTTLFRSTLMARPKVKRLLSTEHFSVDGTLVQAWASMKSVKPIDAPIEGRSEEHTSELQSLRHLVCRLLLEKKKNS